MKTIPSVDNQIVAQYRIECLEQPQALARVLKGYTTDSTIRRELELLRKSVSLQSPLLWLGMGASYCAGLAGATKLTLAGIPSFAVEAAEWLHFGLETANKIAGPILVTTSGESVELVDLCRHKLQSPIVVCNEITSPCWAAARYRFPVLAGIERENATKTYTNSTAACIIIAAELAGLPWESELKVVLESFHAALDIAHGLRGELDEFCSSAKTIEFMGRGGALAGALMGALCLREMTGIRATALSSAAFRHGPIFDVDSSHVAIILALGRRADLGVRLAKDCISRGGKAILMSSEAQPESERLLPIRIPSVPEPWEALTSIVLAQMLTLGVIERVGTDYVRIQTTEE